MSWSTGWLPLCWVGLLLAWARQRSTPRARALMPAGLAPAPWSARLGRSIRRVARRPSDLASDHRMGRAVLAAAGLLMVDVRLAIAAALALYLLPVFDKRRSRRQLEASVIRELPEVIDLIRLSLASGGGVLIALRGVAGRPLGPVSSALGVVCAQVDSGHRTADALEGLVAETTVETRPLVRALVGAEHYGAELMPTLDRLAREARDVRRRRAQASARRVPIRLLLPLVICILPAFVLLTLVPTLAGTLDGLGLG